MRAERSFMPGYNYYVPAMQAAADLGQLKQQRVRLGTPAVQAANDISNAGIIANNAVATTLNLSASTPAPFGRSVRLTASGATGATITMTVHGRDYLGQFMRENIAIANGDGTTPIAGLKAFKYVDKITYTGTASNAVTVSAGWGAKFGLPYVTEAVEREYANDVVAAAGTLQAPVFTDPQTATTGDPRGMYTPTTTPNGTTKIELDVDFGDVVNANNRGGMHGIPHFNG